MSTSGCFYQADFAQTDFIQPCVTVEDVQPGGGAGGTVGGGVHKPRHVPGSGKAWSDDAIRRRSDKKEPTEQPLEELERALRELPAQPAKVKLGGLPAFDALLLDILPKQRPSDAELRQRRIDLLRLQAEQAAVLQKLKDDNAAAFMLLLD